MSLTFQETLNEAQAAAREGRLSQKTDKELDAFLLVCRQWCSGNPRSSEVLNPTVDALCEEIERRNAERRHNQQIEKYDQLKSSVDELRKPQKPHWSLTPTFWITLAILIVALLSWLFPRVSKIPSDKPVILMTNSAPTPTNLPPVTPVTNKTPPVAPAAIQGTNHPVKQGL